MRREPETGAGPSAGGRPVDQVLASGLFDQVHYELQRRQSFDSEEDAARDYLRHGGPAGLAPHPLFEPEWHQPASWRARPDALLHYLGGGEGGGPGPWFDEHAYLAGHPEAATHPGRGLGHFLEGATPSDPMPATAGGPALSCAEALERARADAAEFARFEDLRRAVRRGPWDREADLAFVREWSERPAPRPEGETPVVTVVMPVRNRPRQVLEAIASIQAQTLADWELVVVDDGSTDETLEVLHRAAATDPRVRVVALESSGVSAARNAGIEAARGGWLTFLDSDNTWVPHFLHVILAHLESRGLEAGYAVIDASASSADEATGFLVLDAGLDHLLVRNHIDLNGLAVRTSVARRAGGFDPALRRWVDHDFAIRVARRTEVRLVPFVGVVYDHADTSLDRITTTESDHWQWVVLGNNHVDWAALERDLGERVVGRTSICMPTYEDWQLTRTAVLAVLEAGGDDDLEVVVVDNGSRRAVAVLLRALFASEPRVRIVSVPRNLNFAIGSNLAFAHSTGDVVVFLNNDTEVLPGWLEPLRSALEDEQVAGAQPLLLYPDGSVQSAGTVFPGGNLLPSPLLVHHPPDDARAIAPIRLHVATAAALAMRATDVVALRGFDPLFVNGFEDVDLCLRAVDRGPRRFAVATDSVVLHHESKTPGRGARVQPNRVLFLERWRDRLPPDELGVLAPLHLQVAHLSPGEAVAEPGHVRMPRPVVVRRPLLTEDGRPCLRWALATDVPVREAAVPGPVSERARALADALRTRGQDVVVDGAESGGRASAYLDDVCVAVRDLTPLAERPGRVNLLWRAEPDPHGSAEEDRYDAVVVGGLDEVDALAEQMLRLAVSVRESASWPVPGRD